MRLKCLSSCSSGDNADTKDISSADRSDLRLPVPASMDISDTASLSRFEKFPRELLTARLVVGNVCVTGVPVYVDEDGLGLDSGLEIGGSGMRVLESGLRVPESALGFETCGSYATGGSGSTEVKGQASGVRNIGCDGDGRLGDGGRELSTLGGRSYTPKELLRALSLSKKGDGNDIEL